MSMHFVSNKDPKSRDYLYMLITDRSVPLESQEFLMSFHRFCLLVYEELRQIDERKEGE